MLTGDFVPIKAQLFNCAGDKFPLAVVTDDTDTPLPGSPVSLSLVALGLYSNNAAVVFPDNSQFIRVQITVYDDALHTIISPDQSSMVQTWKVADGGFWYSDAIPMRVGDPIPMTFQTFDGSVDQFVRAFLRDINDAVIPGSPVDLVPGSLGIYEADSVIFPQTNFATVQYVVYEDSGYTVISPDQSASLDQFLLNGPVPDLPAVAFSATAMIGILDSDACEDNGLQDEIVKGADRQLYVRLIRSDNQEPFDLTSAINIEARFKTDDDSVLSVKYTDPGAPITILSRAIGKFVVQLTSAQTILLLAQNPVPFAIVVTMSGGAKTIINFPYQLAVFDETP